MILHQAYDDNRDNPARHLTAIFGLGLIGKSILRSLRSSIPGSTRNFPFSWNDAETREAQSAALIQYMIGCTQTGPGDLRVDVVWSAGRAGFQGTQDRLSGEMRAFETVIDCVTRLRSLGSISGLCFHMLSSGGGLFEAQRCVDQTSQPKPLRPYGINKLEQEDIVEGLPRDIVHFIYRPSSVYGYVGRMSRAGLAVALLDSTMTNRTARIFGNADTLRDFVFSDDVGRYISAQILMKRSISQKCLLASGRPTSMTEMIRLVERIQDRNISIQFDVGDNNAGHNTFRKSACPPNWLPTPLETGVFITAMRMRDDLVANPVMMTRFGQRPGHAAKV